MLLLSALLGCVHQVSWEVQPRPSYTLPSLEVAVVALDRNCKKVADQLVEVLSARPGVVVRPAAVVQLGVEHCDDGADTTVEVDLQFPGLNLPSTIFSEERRYTRRAWASGEVRVSGPNAPVTLLGKAERVERSGWQADGPLEMPRAPTIREALRRDLAHDLADQIAPLPETMRRMVYRDPEPGTARELHNAAVEAEQRGELQEALRLARLAYAANPTRGALGYIDELKDHAESVGYALLVEPGRAE